MLTHTPSPSFSPVSSPCEQTASSAVPAEVKYSTHQLVTCCMIPGDYEPNNSSHQKAILPPVNTTSTQLHFHIRTDMVGLYTHHCTQILCSALSLYHATLPPPTTCGTCICTSVACTLMSGAAVRSGVGSMEGGGLDPELSWGSSSGSLESDSDGRESAGPVTIVWIYTGTEAVQREATYHQAKPYHPHIKHCRRYTYICIPYPVYMVPATQCSTCSTPVVKTPYSLFIHWTIILQK